MKDRHAYLIMTHGNFEILKLQLEMLDDSRNDIYIHVDKKVKNFDFLFFRTYVKKAHIEFTKKRINVRWGGQTLVLAELLLFKEASTEYYGAAEPPVRCGESHLSGLTEPPHFIY